MFRGEWLRNCGFDVCDEVLVTVEKNRLTIDFEKRNGDWVPVLALQQSPATVKLQGFDINEENK